jgi:transposase-like protein
MLLLGYFWLTKTPFNLACIFTGHSAHTVSAYYKHYRQLVSDSLDDDDTLIGGPNIVVEIDESKFGKRKYNRGHRVEGCWVLGGVERTEERKLFVLTVNDRSAETLLQAITTHVKSGSIIYTDLWKGYSQLAALGFTHCTVNHSLYYKDPITNVHTNGIEGTWNGIKLTIAPRGRIAESMDERLLEFVWRRKYNACLWAGFISALRTIKYIQ